MLKNKLDPKRVLVPFLNLGCSLSSEIELEPEKEDDAYEEAEEGYGFDPNEIRVQPKQDTLRNLLDRIRNHEIDLNPDFQRNADLWSPIQMSRLIESILIRFPLPAFYFDASQDDNWLVVDGIQRLSAIKKFVLEDDPKERLRLRGLEFLRELIGKTYPELERHYQRRINECPIFMYQIMPGTPEPVKYSIFHRINTGGLRLNAQEIRNALAKPREREFLARMCGGPNFRNAMGDRSKRMVDQELALRFIAFLKLDYQQSRKNIAKFLDEAFSFVKKASDSELEKIERAFQESLRLCYEIFGTYSFEKRYSDRENHRLKNASLFEAWTVNTANLPEETARLLVERREMVIAYAEACLKEPDFYRSISEATQKHEHIFIRHSRIKKLIEDVTHA